MFLYFLESGIDLVFRHHRNYSVTNNVPPDVCSTNKGDNKVLIFSKHDRIISLALIATFLVFHHNLLLLSFLITILHFCMYNSYRFESVKSENREQRLKEVDVIKGVKSNNLISQNINTLQSTDSGSIYHTSRDVSVCTSDVPSTSRADSNTNVSESNSYSDASQNIELIPDIDSLQNADNDLKMIKDIISSGEKPTWQQISKHSPELKYSWNHIDSLVLKNNVLYRKWEENENSDFKLLLVIPKLHRTYVLKQLHDNKRGGHLGVKKTLHKIRERYFWFTLRKDVENWCKACIKCNSRRISL